MNEYRDDGLALAKMISIVRMQEVSMHVDQFLELEMKSMVRELLNETEWENRFMAIEIKIRLVPK